MAQREDLGIDDAWKNVPLMRDVETVLRTFSRSAVKRCVATLCKSDVAHSGPRCALGACVYAQTHDKLEGTLL